MTGLRVFDDVEAYLHVVEETLMHREAENALILGVALRLRSGHAYGDETPFFACAEAGDKVIGVFARTPPHNLLVHVEEGHHECLEPLADELQGRGMILPGVHGRIDAAEAFAKGWNRRTGGTSHVGMAQRLFKLTEVSPPLGVPGAPRSAEDKDLEQAVSWAEAFVAEAIPGEPTTRIRVSMERLIETKQLLLWEDGQPVSMCASGRPTPNGISINLVYTPPKHRGHGYASANVAEISHRLLDSGKTFCTLFTDLSNSTSNKIYQQVGYRPLGDFAEIRFEPQAEAADDSARS